MTVDHDLIPKLEESSRYREPMPDSRWQTLWNKLARELRELHGDLVERLVRQIRDDIEWLDGHLTRYCELTCPVCTDPCCLAQNVFYNQADLLYLVVRQESAAADPSGETKTPIDAATLGGREAGAAFGSTGKRSSAAPPVSRLPLPAFEGPPGQTREQAADPCRYLARQGCLLPRIERPYVCVWFLCEPQMELFAEEPAAFQRRFIKVLKNIRTNRLHLEFLYEQHLRLPQNAPSHP